MRKTKLWVIAGTLLMSLLVGAAIGRLAGGGSAGDAAGWTPPAPTATALDQPTPSASPVIPER